MKKIMLYGLLLMISLIGCAEDPVADPGEDKTIQVGDIVTLSGAQSDKTTGDNLTYLWEISSAPEGSTATLSSPTVMAPTFIPDKPGDYIFTLIVYNPWPSEPEQVKITCVPLPPIKATDLSASVTAEEISRTETLVSFSITASLTNKTASLLAISMQIIAKDNLGDTVFTRTNNYSINPGEAIQVTTDYPEGLTVEQYDSILEWSVGTISRK